MRATTPSPTSPCPARLEIERLERAPRMVYGAIAASFAAFVAGGGTGWLGAWRGVEPSDLPELYGGALDAHRPMSRSAPSGRSSRQ